MCLILASTASKIRAVLLDTPGLLQDIYDSNSDGIGAMYVTARNKLRVPKIVPANMADAERFIRQLPNDDRQMAVHWRYKTHGAVDLTNCHPYPVVQGKIHFMHNGVLPHGNADDSTKSDTWHYAAKVLTPQLSVYPDLFKMPEWLGLVEEDIGKNNRFVFMDESGEMVIANKDTGIEHDGIWFSNTYAWSPELLIPGYVRRTSYSSYNWKGWRDMDDDYSGLTSAGYSGTSGTKSAGTAVLAGGYYNTAVCGQVWDAIGDGNAEELAKVLKEWPISSFNVLFDGMMFVTNDPATLATPALDVCQLLEQGDVNELSKRCRASDAYATLVAECATLFGEWIDVSDAEAMDADEESEFDRVAAVDVEAKVVDATEAKGEVYAG